MDDVIWDNTNSCNVSLDDMNDTEALVNINQKNNHHYDNTYDVLETMNGCQECGDPPNIIEHTSPDYESLSEYIEPNFYIGDCQT